MAKGMVMAKTEEKEEDRRIGGLIKLFLYLDLRMLRAEPERNHFS